MRRTDTVKRPIDILARAFYEAATTCPTADAAARRILARLAEQGLEVVDRAEHRREVTRLRDRIAALEHERNARDLEVA